MIHMVLCDLELIPTKVANSEYFIVFVDGDIKYCYLYLLESKDIDKIVLYKQVENQLIIENKVARSHIGELLKEKNRALEDMVNAMFLSPGLSHGISSRIDDEVVQDQRQRDDNDLQYERQDQPKEEEVKPKRSKRARIEKSFRPDFVSFMVENEPTSYREALVGLLSGCKPLGYKWIFKKKMKADGTIDKYKARLVIKGFRQCEGLDFFDTYLPVTRITSIRMVLAIVALRKLEVHQMDMEMTFLNGDLENVLYMNQPEGFMAPGLESKVCRLVKSLYDSWKAPKQGHQFSPYHVRMWI
ncbi:retrotransposon protein, putative, ty1-copia subclass [Tanacetum coccineum]